ncbi:fatty-acid synthase complex protein, putative [Wickerhamomyces ciferrii]|uniref:Fatty acid synthase subunit alpha n=1 Tax=Wickerhamomyces ciferrii (strain ATCC 14091 / BCRC 22168 / CBS 111 / JCM 3599 / NBRC 0793 / NRRL Y-1031 F-60-10) TaxID=1206466 RepID=K0KWH4_WICCF|nr:fatty-acid synthase complex protein, putative [Wickerhamomyces ciferrii]CCH46337.1 fatty-acid synthase complex protein, putative [Wickerhamomyces ciferrii]
MRPEIEQELAHVLLTELLAYQFASPVRWIETQDVFLKDYNTERVVEIGPSPTLAGMATRTIKAKYESYDAALSLQRQVLCYAKDAKEIYYTPDPADLEAAAAAASGSGSAATESASAQSSAPAASATPASAAAAPSAPAPAPSGPVAEIPDEPVKALLLIHVLVAQKLKKSLDQVPVSKAIKDLVNGKSTVQNEILGDLGKEFGSTPEKPEETPIEELAETFQETFSGALGKQSSSLIARLMSSKMPGGFSVGTARKYLQTRWGLGSGRQDSVLLLSLTSEPPARLGNENDAKAYLDGIAQKYAASANISLASAASSGGSSGGAGGATIDAAAFEELTKDNKILARQQLQVLARYLKLDLNKGNKLVDEQKDQLKDLQDQLDHLTNELGDYFIEGITSSFSRKKARTYDSSWNWSRQSLLTLYFEIIHGTLKRVDRELVSEAINIMNRSNDTLIKFMEYHINQADASKGENYILAKELGNQLIENCKQVLDLDPVYKDISYPLGPKTNVDHKGNIKYSEEPRENVRKFQQYVHEMSQGSEVTRQPQQTIEQDLTKVYNAISKQAELSSGTKVEFEKLYGDLIKFLQTSNEIEIKQNTTVAGFNDDNLDSDSTKEVASLPTTSSIKNPVSKVIPPETIPFLHLKKRLPDDSWAYDRQLTSVFLDGLEQAAVNGVTFKGKHVLITGAGAGSIGAEVLKGLIQGGANVILTTSRFSKKVTEYYQQIYAKYGARGSSLVVVPFNQGSKQDVEALVDYIYDDVKKGGLGWDLDAIVPFAAIPENGNEINNIDSKSEFAHRIMLTNLLRILGSVKNHKSDRGIETRPAQVILPMSPNHGTFGADGLYSESKLSLETLFNRWYSESWANQLTICGAVIGWTRGTGLMSANNIISEGIEKLGVRTFSQSEMGFNLLGLLTPEITDLCQKGPVLADLNGGLQFISSLKERTNKLRSEIMETSDIRRAVSIETALEHKIVNGSNADAPFAKTEINPRANMKFDFPTLKSYDEIKKAAPQLEGLLNLEKVIVVTGFSEVSPWGSARTRWEMEAYGEFSLEGCIEIAWIMGLIKYHNGNLKGRPYSGWVDAKTNEPVDDKDVKPKYEEHILDHCGIRLIEPELFNGYNPNKKELVQEVVIEEDLAEFEASKETAEHFKHQHGDKVSIQENPESGEYTVQILKGASLLIPKALKFDRLVAGQIPTGWDARRYGISEDTIQQVDPITLYVLVATVEAFISAGISDPYELYKYIHVSELGNCSGSGMGGVSALRGMFKDRYKDEPVQNDVLQESFINTMSAWVNMLLISSSGPIKTPVGACATAVESLDIGVETIISGKAKVCIVGGYDDFQEEGSYEFANMNATSNTLDEFEHGRTPSEMSRPATTTRNGFMEAQGSGIQVIMNADLAIKMGVPIYGVLGLTATASDSIGRSVPAPGKGILTTAREHHGDLKHKSTLMDISYRKRQVERRIREVKQWVDSEYEFLGEDAKQYPEEEQSTYITERVAEIQSEAQSQINQAKDYYGNFFYQNNPRIAPIRGALATFGLTIDDIDVCSMHGTSTKANDKNESNTLDLMFRHLGRSEGNPALTVVQKYLTGHPKGAAGAWMFNGALQILNSGIVPGNRNADNIDAVLEQFDYLLFPSRSIKTDGVKAVSITSFGFGQKGAQAIAINSDYLFGVLSREQYETYAAKFAERHNKAYSHHHEAFINNSLFRVKDKAPYSDELQNPVYLDPLARVGAAKSGKLEFAQKGVQGKGGYITASSKDTSKILSDLASNAAGKKNVGVDVELISSINIENETFIERNFTEAEIKYCQSAPSPQSSFAGTWSAKEAVFKALGVESKGAGAQLKDIEILRDSNGAPKVQFHGDALKVAKGEVKVSISHDDFQSVAVAILN